MWLSSENQSHMILRDVGAWLRPYSGFESEWENEGSDTGNTRNMQSNDR